LNHILIFTAAIIFLLKSCFQTVRDTGNVIITGLRTMNDNTTDFHIRTKIWFGNRAEEFLFGKGKMQILEYVDQEGSISGAAEKMGLSYKKVWTHIKNLQSNIEDELVVSKTGGGGKGGTTLTPKAKELVKRFKQLDEEIRLYADRRFEELFLPDLPVK